MATIQQNRYLWAFEVRNSTAKPLNWSKLDLSTAEASAIINACTKFEDLKRKNARDISLEEDLTGAFKRHNPLFRLKPLFRLTTPPPPPPPSTTPPEQIIKEVEVIKEVTKTVTLDDGMSLDQIIETIMPLVKGASIIKDIYDAKVPEIPAFNTQKNYFKPDNFDLITATVKTGVHVLIKGPAGSGKSLLASQIAHALTIPYFCFSCSGGMKYGHVFGADELYTDPETKQTISRFKLSNLMDALQKPGLVLMDELFTLESDILMGLNGLFEPGTRQIETKGGLVKMHKNCLVMAATNTDGRNLDRSHIGAKKVDGSSLDRFATFYFGYSAAAEKGILNQLPAKPRKFIQETLATFRKNLELNNIAFSASTRRLTTCVKLTLSGINPIDAFSAAFTGQLSTAEIKKLNLDKLTYI